MRRVALLWIAFTVGLAAYTAFEWTLKPQPDLSDILTDMIGLFAASAASYSAYRTPRMSAPVTAAAFHGLFLVTLGMAFDLLDELFSRPSLVKHLCENGSIALGLLLFAISLRGWFSSSLAARVSEDRRDGWKLLSVLLPLTATGSLAICGLTGWCPVKGSLNTGDLWANLAVFVASTAALAVAVGLPDLGSTGFLKGVSLLKVSLGCTATFAVSDLADELIKVPKPLERVVESYSLMTGLILMATGLWLVRLCANEVMGALPPRALLWVDPADTYLPKVLRVVTTSVGQRRPVIITWRGSPLGRALFQSLGDAVIVYTRTGESFPRQISDTEYVVSPTLPQVMGLLQRLKSGEGPIAVIVDNLTDVTMVLGPEKTYMLVREILDCLNSEDSLIAIAFRGSLPSDQEGRLRSIFGPLGNVEL